MSSRRRALFLVASSLTLAVLGMKMCADTEALAAGPNTPEQTATLTEDELARVYDGFNCGDTLVMCVDIYGNLLSKPPKSGDGGRVASKVLPRPAPTDQMLIRVLGHGGALAGKTLKLAGPGLSTKAERKFPAAPDGGVSAQQDLSEKSAATGGALSTQTAKDTEATIAKQKKEAALAALDAGVKGPDAGPAMAALVANAAVTTRAAQVADAEALVAKLDLLSKAADKSSSEAQYLVADAGPAESTPPTGARNAARQCSDAPCWAGVAKSKAESIKRRVGAADGPLGRVKNGSEADAAAGLVALRTEVDAATAEASDAADALEKARKIVTAKSDAKKVDEAAKADAGSESAPGPTRDDLQLLLVSLTVTVPDAPNFLVECHLDVGTDSTACGSYSISIDRRAPYHFEVMLSVPLIFGGARTVGLSTLPGSNLKTLDVRNDLEVSTALGLHYFPFGVRGGGAWVEGVDTTRSSSVPAFWRYLFTYLIQPWGLEAGTAISNQLFKNIQVGLAFEPVRGGSVSFGVAALQGQFLQPGWRAGMLYPENTPLPVDTLFMFRPYVGFSISPEILSLLLDALQQAQRISPPAGRTPETNGH